MFNFKYILIKINARFYCIGFCQTSLLNMDDSNNYLIPKILQNTTTGIIPLNNYIYKISHINVISSYCDDSNATYN